MPPTKTTQVPIAAQNLAAPAGDPNAVVRALAGGNVRVVPCTNIEPAKVKAALKNAALRAQNNMLTLTHRENLTMLVKEIFGDGATLENL